MRRLLMVLVAGALLAGCVGGEGQEDGEPTVERLPVTLIGDPPAALALDGAAEGGGAHPELSWEAVDGAAWYDVTVYGPSGRGYWSWQGAETSVHLGGAALDDGAPGPAVAEGMTWQVAAYDADGSVIALSDRRPIRP